MTVIVYRIHYKEYLVGLVIRHGIDPAEVMTADELTVLLKRAERKVPRRGWDDSVAQHTRQLLDVRFPPSSSIYLTTFDSRTVISRGVVVRGHGGTASPTFL